MMKFLQKKRKENFRKGSVSESDLPLTVVHSESADNATTTTNLAQSEVTTSQALQASQRGPAGASVPNITVDVPLDRQESPSSSLAAQAKSKKIGSRSRGSFMKNLRWSRSKDERHDTAHSNPHSTEETSHKKSVISNIFRSKSKAVDPKPGSHSKATSTALSSHSNDPIHQGETLASSNPAPGQPSEGSRVGIEEAETKSEGKLREAASFAADVDDNLDKLSDTLGNFEPLVEKLKVFTGIIEGIGEVRQLLNAFRNYLNR